MHDRDRRNKRHHGEPPQEPPKPRKSLIMQTPVLVLNASYEPINICAARRAIVLVLKGLAMPEEEQERRNENEVSPLRRVDIDAWGSDARGRSRGLRPIRPAPLSRSSSARPPADTRCAKG